MTSSTTRSGFGNPSSDSLPHQYASFAKAMYKDLHGDEKLAKAVEAASEMFASHGITVSAVEMRMMIEAALAEFNNAFNQHDIIEITEETGEDSKDTDNAEDGE